jgi:hypothetical protein
MFADHIINNTYFFYLYIINDNTLSSTVPILGPQTSPEINLKKFELIIQNVKIILPHKSLLRGT